MKIMNLNFLGDQRERNETKYVLLSLALAAISTLCATLARRNGITPLASALCSSISGVGLVACVIMIAQGVLSHLVPWGQRVIIPTTLAVLAILLVWMAARGMATSMSHAISAGISGAALVALSVLKRDVRRAIRFVVMMVPHGFWLATPLVAFSALDVYFAATHSYSRVGAIMPIGGSVCALVAAINCVGTGRSLDPVMRWLFGSLGAGFSLSSLSCFLLAANPEVMPNLFPAPAINQVLIFMTILLLGWLPTIPAMYVGSRRRSHQVGSLINAVLNGSGRTRRLATAALAELMATERWAASKGWYAHDRWDLAQGGECALAKAAVSALGKALRDKESTTRELASEAIKVLDPNWASSHG